MNYGNCYTTSGTNNEYLKLFENNKADLCFEEDPKMETSFKKGYENIPGYGTIPSSTNNTSFVLPTIPKTNLVIFYVTVNDKIAPSVVKTILKTVEEDYAIFIEHMQNRGNYCLVLPKVSNLEVGSITVEVIGV